MSRPMSDQALLISSDGDIARFRWIFMCSLFKRSRSGRHCLRTGAQRGLGIDKVAIETQASLAPAARREVQLRRIDAEASACRLGRTGGDVRTTDACRPVFEVAVESPHVDRVRLQCFKRAVTLPSRRLLAIRSMRPCVRRSCRCGRPPVAAPRPAAVPRQEQVRWPVGRCDPHGE